MLFLFAFNVNIGFPTEETFHISLNELLKDTKEYYEEEKRSDNYGDVRYKEKHFME